MIQLTRASALGFAALFLLTGCVVFPVTPDEESEQKAVVGAAVESTVEAAISLAVEATITAMDASAMDSTSEEASQDASSAQTDTDSEDESSLSAEAVASTDNEPPMLITPTPDRSGEIAEFIVANTRHFRGDPNAPVVLVEFSDFM